MAVQVDLDEDIAREVTQGTIDKTTAVMTQVLRNLDGLSATLNEPVKKNNPGLQIVSKSEPQ